MNLTTKICGWLVAVVWFACGAFGLFYVYLLLTFYIFAPKTIAENFRENRLAVVSCSLLTVVFFTGAVGVLLRRAWARLLSLLLCAVGASFGSVQIFSGEPSNRSTGAAVVIVLFSVLAWLFSMSGRTYFGQAAQPA